MRQREKWRGEAWSVRDCSTTSSGGALLQVASRYLTHVLVLLSAIVVPTLTIGGLRPHSSGPVITAFGAERPLAPTRGFLLKPAAASATPVKRDIQTYNVQSGDTLSGVASQFGLAIDTLRWANGLKDVDSLSLGQQLLIPPVDGVLLTVKSSDTIDALAAKYQVTAQSIIEYNLLRDPKHLVNGSQLMIPDGVGDPAAAKAKPKASSTGSISSFRTTYFGPGGHFPWGYCTWYVSTRRYIPWSGDAHSWFYNAQAYGYATGRYPRPGAIMVTWESWWGHVAYVESVDGSCWTVSEMNYRGFGIVDYRHICPGQVPLIGFVY